MEHRPEVIETICRRTEVAAMEEYYHPHIDVKLRALEYRPARVETKLPASGKLSKKRRPEQEH